MAEMAAYSNATVYGDPWKARSSSEDIGGDLVNGDSNADQDENHFGQWMRPEDGGRPYRLGYNRMGESLPLDWSMSRGVEIDGVQWGPRRGNL